MRAELKPHPQTPCAALSGIEAQVSRSAGGFEATFLAHGDIGKLKLPRKLPSARADELWKHTCFELFLRPEDGDDYVELNFSPSTQWAAYAFSGCREGMRNLELAPRISVAVAAASLDLRAAFDLDALNETLSRPLRLGASAVIEVVSGEKSYWALAHPLGKPDFHHRDSFSVRMEPGIA